MYVDGGRVERSGRAITDLERLRTFPPSWGSSATITARASMDSQGILATDGIRRHPRSQPNKFSKLVFLI